MITKLSTEWLWGIFVLVCFAVQFKQVISDNAVNFLMPQFFHLQNGLYWNSLFCFSRDFRELNETVSRKCVHVSCSIVSNCSWPTDCSPPGSSVHGTFQARILEWVAIPFSRRSSSWETEPKSPALCWATGKVSREVLCKIQNKNAHTDKYVYLTIIFERGCVPLFLSLGMFFEHLTQAKHSTSFCSLCPFFGNSHQLFWDGYDSHFHRYTKWCLEICPSLTVRPGAQAFRVSELQ